jgi:hypothetical protein
MSRIKSSGPVVTFDDGEAKNVDQLGGQIDTTNTLAGSNGQHHRIAKYRAITKHRAELRAPFDHLCANGKLFTGIKRPKGFRQMRRRDCFRNSQSLAIDDGRATYVEGLCIHRSEGVAFAHGWLTLDGEHAIDVTLRNAESYAYFGIAFEDRRELARAIRKDGCYKSRLGLGTVMDVVPPELVEAIENRRVAQ